MIQRRRPTLQRAQIVLRIEDLLVLAVRTWMRRDHLGAEHDGYLLDIGLHRHRLESRRPRDTVAVVVEAHRLVLVGPRRLHDARIERTLRQGQRVVTIAGKPLTDRLGLAGLDALTVAHTAVPQIHVQCRQVRHLRHRRGPVALQMTHPALDPRLLLRTTHQAELCVESIVTHQRLVALVELAFAAHEQVRRHRLGVVPPQFAGHAAEESECLDQAVQDRLGPLRRQGERERSIGIPPGHEQHRHEPTPIGKVDVDMAEVRLQPLPRIVVQRDEGLTLRPPLGKDILPHAVVAAVVAVLVAQTTKDLGHRVPLLPRRGLVATENRVDHRREWIDHRGHPSALVLLGLGLSQDLPDLAARVMKPPGELANAQLIEPMRLAYACIFVHLDHPPPPVSWRSRLR